MHFAAVKILRCRVIVNFLTWVHFIPPCLLIKSISVAI